MENVTNKIKEVINDMSYQQAVRYSNIVDNDYKKSFNIADKKCTKKNESSKNLKKRRWRFYLCVSLNAGY